MTDAAPKRIWVSAPNEDNEVETWTDPDEGGTEYILASEHAAQIAAEQTAWRADPESSEAWCFGNQYALDRLCHVLGVDPDKVDWDGSDGSRDEEADSLINRILRANDDADGNSPEVAALIREAEARGMERAAEICEVIRTSIANGPMPEGARFDYEQAIRAAKGAQP